MPKRLTFNEDGSTSVTSDQGAPPRKKRKLLNDGNIGRHWTISVAIPGSIMRNVLTQELRTTLAGQIARCLTIFKVDEVIVFDEPSSGGTDKAFQNQDTFNPCHFLARLLQYQECPQFVAFIS